MLAQSAMLGGAVPDRSPLGWLILLPLGCLLLGQILLVTTGIVPVLDGVLVDPDGYMRLNRVLALHDGGSWFDSTYWRIDPPTGHVQHWTRPLDLLLLAGGSLLEPVLGFRQGLHLWGVLFSPTCLALSVVALAWAIEPVLDRDARLFACLAYLMQPTVLAYASVGRPDHHALLLLLFVILLGLTFRLLIDPLDRRSARLAGAVAALSLWVSIESLTFVGCSITALGLYWLLGDGDLARQNREYGATLASALALALLVERGPAQLLVAENDRLSILHVTLFALIALFWLFAARSGHSDSIWSERVARVAVHRRQPFVRYDPPAPRSAGMAGRLVLAGAGLVSVALAMLILFPDVARGPIGAVDPLYDRLRLQRIVEIQPLVSREQLAAGQLGEIANRIIQVLGIAFAAVPFLVVLLRRPGLPGHRIWVGIALALAVFLPLATYEVRWSSYAQILLVPPYSAFVAWLLLRVAERLPPSRLQLVRPLIIVVALFWPLGLTQLMPRQQIVTATEVCPIGRISPVLNGLGPPGTILALADYGPELLYRTPHAVLSIPNHRPQPGFNAGYRALTATDLAAARSELGRHGVDWILLCPSVIENSYFVEGHEGERTLYRRLVDGTPPPWLHPVALDEDLRRSVRLYALDSAAASATAGKPGEQP
ncbi:MAG TPA: hypothetical protein VFV80_06400 [Geminicoccaceae bacterium]|nr:hypothetical protein [Geminicoccaceae bacterium]